MARGVNYATALELALKFKELAYLFAEPYSTADFLHGPMALAERDLPAIVLGVRGPAQSSVVELSQRLVAAGVRLFPISDEPSRLRQATSGHSLSLAAALERIPEPLSPIVSVIPGQFLAMSLAARRRGGDPDLDNARGLSKITRTD
jgi:glutamine---fructose-6-phosphate transaminase (isomerizing)